jgi:endonuclease/exonuclease/phosphatase family metal-dependent hydrolase
VTGTDTDSTLGTAAGRPRPLRQIVAATYNIHRCVGTDGRYGPGRIAAVLEELDADIIGLQEVDIRPTTGGGRDQLSFLAHRLGFHVAAGLNIVRHRGHYGNALMSRWPILNSRLIDLSATGREPRGGVDADVAWPSTSGGGTLRAIVTHFGLRGWERRRQMATLLEHIGGDADAGRPLLLMGDFNEWVRFGAVSRHLGAALICAPHVGSFPARWPLFPLDRICSRSLTLSCRPTRHVSETSRVASDHLPIKAIFALPPAASSSPPIVQMPGSPNSDHNLI